MFEFFLEELKLDLKVSQMQFSQLNNNNFTLYDAFHLRKCRLKTIRLQMKIIRKKFSNIVYFRFNYFLSTRFLSPSVQQLNIHKIRFFSNLL